MSWNIVFSRKLVLKFHNKLGLFHMFLQEEDQKNFANCYRITKFTKLAEFERILSSIPF